MLIYSERGKRHDDVCDSGKREDGMTKNSFTHRLALHYGQNLWPATEARELEAAVSKTVSEVAAKHAEELRSMALALDIKDRCIKQLGDLLKEEREHKADAEALRAAVENVVAAHARVLEVERFAGILGVYLGEADYLIAARGANKTLDDAVSEARQALDRIKGGAKEFET
jgi:hypothetical protein